MALKLRGLLAAASTLLTLALRRRRAGPGRFVRRFYATKAGSRFYKLYLPACYRGQSLPLIVMLHGCKQTPDEFAAGTRMNELADRYGFSSSTRRRRGARNSIAAGTGFAATTRSATLASRRSSPASRTR